MACYGENIQVIESGSIDSHSKVNKMALFESKFLDV